ncbi:MAG: hypothetical protein ABR585_07745 [Gemmatimonadaceae bacterium]
MSPLPPPLNGAEEYLAAIHTRLGEVLDRLPERPAAPQEQAPVAGPETVELREPATPAEEPEGEALTEPAPPARTSPARKRSTRKGGT